MRKTRALPALAATALVTVGLVATEGSASAAPFGDVVAVHGNADGLTVQHGMVYAGLVRFLVDTSNDQGTDVSMFTLASGETLDDVKAALHDEFSPDGPTAAKGTRELLADTRLYGLAAVVKGTPVTVTQQIPAGTYYLFDIGPVFAGQEPEFTTLQVSGPSGPIFPFPGHGIPFPLFQRQGTPSHLPGTSSGQTMPGHSALQGLPGPIGAPPVAASPAAHVTFPFPGFLPPRGSFPFPGFFPGYATVKLTSEDRFDGPDVLPKAGTITVRNVSDTLHFMLVTPVKDGTTDQDVQKFFDTSTGPADRPAFALEGPSIEMDVQSPGRQASISYQLPAGTYVLECFIADETDGIPHAIMGMHKVVTLK